MVPSADVVGQLWRLCSILRKDGITYQDYVTELTYLLFIKMAGETGADAVLPSEARWKALVGSSAVAVLPLYRGILGILGEAPDTPPSIRRIFEGATTSIKDSTRLGRLIKELDRIAWFDTSLDSFGQVYEGLLAKSAEETKRGSGQYFTPRVVAQMLTDLLKPTSGEIIQDPAAGTGGFLVCAAGYSRQHGGACVVSGMENVRDTHRLLLMNLYLHGVDATAVHAGDTLSHDWLVLGSADVILTNPPFGGAGGKPTRTDLVVTGAVTSFAMPFVEHCINALKPGGRAAVIVPDSVLFEEGRGLALRRLLLERCDLHTILRLPTGIFYAAGVKTSVLFFRKGRSNSETTRAVWFYDLRTEVARFNKTTPITSAYFDDFRSFYGLDPNGSDRPADRIRSDKRARRFSREDIAARGDNLDLNWLREEAATREELMSDPDAIIADVVEQLEIALMEVRALAAEFKPASSTPEFSDMTDQ